MCPNTYEAFNPSRPNSEQKENIKLNFYFSTVFGNARDGKG